MSVTLIIVFTLSSASFAEVDTVSNVSKRADMSDLPKGDTPEKTIKKRLNLNWKIR